MKKNIFLIFIGLVIVLLFVILLTNKDATNTPVEELDYDSIKDLDPDIEILENTIPVIMDTGSGDSFKIYISKKLLLKTTNSYTPSTGSVDSNNLYEIQKSNLDNIMNLIKSIDANTGNEAFFYPSEEVNLSSEKINNRIEQYQKEYLDNDQSFFTYYILNYKNNTYFILSEDKQNILKENLEFAN